jgi:hypothetical protein
VKRLFFSEGFAAHEFLFLFFQVWSRCGEEIVIDGSVINNC